MCEPFFRIIFQFQKYFNNIGKDYTLDSIVKSIKIAVFKSIAYFSDTVHYILVFP
jgi:hypothetical protein